MASLSAPVVQTPRPATEVYVEAVRWEATETDEEPAGSGKSYRADRPTVVTGRAQVSQECNHGRRAMLNFDTHTDQAAEPFVVDTLPDRERVIVAPRGELDIATAGRVAAAIDALARTGFVEVVLDLRGLAFMDVAGLRLVLAQARRADVTVELIDGSPAVARLFDLAQ